MGNNQITVKMRDFSVLFALERQAGLKHPKQDETIPASVWNPFVKIVGKKPIKNCIPLYSAELAILKYIEKASESDKDKIANYFGFYKATKEEADEYDEKAVKFLKELAENPSDLEFSEDTTVTPFGTKFTDVKAKLPDGRYITAVYNKTKGDKLTGIYVNFDTKKNQMSLYNLKTFDGTDVIYHSDGTIAYSTPKINADSRHYDITGVNFERVAELTEQILKNRNNTEKE